MQRQDYILRMIGELRQFVRGALGAGGSTGAKEALHAVMHAQQQLFQQPVAEVLALSLHEQIEQLGRGHTTDIAAEKVITYAAILGQAALVYDGTSQPDLALGSRQLALGALLTAAIRWPEIGAELAGEIEVLRKQLSDEELNAPVQEMLREWDARD